jgi:hypothetical protein
MAYYEWNGTVWSFMPNSYQGSPNGYLGDVTCTSASFCVALGGDGSTGTPYYLEWNGIGWSLMTPPADNSLPADASCVSPTFCMAFASSNSGNVSTEAVEWNGTAWSTVATFPQTSAVVTEFQGEGLSCTSASLCVAAGGYANPGSPDTYAGAMIWNGTGWIPTPISGPGSSGAFNVVSCGSPSFCVAAGDYGTGNSQLPLAEQWTP